MTKNKESTRYASQKHEESVAKALNGRRQPNSGASKFSAGDVVTNQFLIECKTCLTEKQSFTIKRDWLEKNKEEMFSVRKRLSALCFNFGNNTSNYYIISEPLMKYLVDKIDEENS